MSANEKPTARRTSRAVRLGRHPHVEHGIGERQFADGIFRTAYALRDAGGVSKADRDVLAGQLEWFSKNLLIPKRFNRSSSKGYYRRATKGIAWFREDAGEHISRMFELTRVLEANGHPVHVVRESRVGYIVYEDDAQVIAEPFADTRTGP